MKIPSIIFPWLAIVAVVALAAFHTKTLVDDDAACAKAGGVQLKTDNGFACIKAEVIELP